MRLTVFLTSDKTDFHVPPPSYNLHYSYGFCVSVRMYNIRTPLHNCMVWSEYNRMVWREYSIFPLLHNLMINFKQVIVHIQISSTNFSMVM